MRLFISTIQIKAVHLDDPLTKLIETKILDWKVQQLPDFNKCAHVSNTYWYMITYIKFPVLTVLLIFSIALLEKSCSVNWVLSLSPEIRQA